MPIPKIVVTIALTAAQVAIGMMRKIKGPRLDDLAVSVADYGTPIPRLWGIRRIQPQTIWAEKLHETKVKSKGKGGKYEEYKYDGTWACLICDQEIDAISRIWMDKHLVWQMREKGPISIGGLFSLFLGNGIVKLTRGHNMRFYLGTEDQAIDPRMEAWCEERYGANSCPAYRGSAYIVFQQIPLEKFGNRIPQLTVEAIKNKVPVYPYDIPDQTLATDSRIKFSPDFMRVYNVDINDFVFVWDVPTRQPLLTFASDAGGILGTSIGYIYARGASGLLQIDPDGGEVVLTTVFDFAGGDVFAVGGMICLTPVGGLISAHHYFSGNPDIGVIATAIDFIPSMYFADLAGNPWAVGEVPGEDKVGFCLMPGAATHLVDTTAGGPAYAMCNDEGKFLTWQADKLFVVDPDTWTASTPVAASMGSTAPITPFNNILGGAESIWLHNAEYDTSDASVIRSVTLANWHPNVAGGVVYDPVNHALITGLSGGNTIWLYLDRVSSDGVTLQTVVNDVSEWCGLTGQETSALTQTVLGYSVTQGSGKDMLAPLLDIHDVDARPHDFVIQFVNRGSSPSGTLLTEDFVRDGNSPRYTVTVQQDTDLPRKLTYSYADADHDQQANTTISQRPLDAMDSTREETIDLSTYVDTPDSAQEKGDRHFRRIWNSRERIKNALTHQVLALEPGDVKTLQLRHDDNSVITRNARLDKITITPTTLECEWIRDEADFAILNGATGAPMEGRDPETIYIPGPSKGFVEDIPLVEDADNDVNPIIYYAAGPYMTGSWPGAGVYRGDDGSYDELVGFVESGSPATWGLTTDVLATANPNLWDRGNSVNVSVKNGTLATYTEAEIDADPALNLALLGSEMIQFATATLELDGSYTLTGFKRGRRGTEWAVDTHAISEDFVLCEDLTTLELGAGDIGDSLSFKVQSVGRAIDAAPAVNITYSGASLKPYAPARIIWTTDGTDMFGEIIRRTRIGGTWNGGSPIPLGENSEAYEVDIYNGATFKRTITVTGTNLFTYTGAEIAADSNTVGVVPPFNAYQMSDVAGRGFALAA